MPRFNDVRVESTTCDWGPLERLAARFARSDRLRTLYPGDFMYMQCLEGRDGLRLHCYKHIDTRCYINLDDCGRPYVYVYEPSSELDGTNTLDRRLPSLDVAIDALELDWLDDAS